MTVAISARPLTYRFSKKLFAGATGSTRSADEMIQLAAATTIQTFDAISLPREEFRAIGTMNTTTLAHEQKGARQCLGINGPTVAYRYDNALIADGTWYANGIFENLRSQRRRPILIAGAKDFGEAQLCTDAGSEIYFGHWLCDAMSTQLLAEDRGLQNIDLGGASRMHEAGYRDLMSLPSQEVSVARVESLWIIDDRGYNENRIDRFLRLRQRVRSKAPPSGASLVYIDRGASGVARNLLNRNEVVDALIKMGFTVISPEAMKPDEIVSALASAQLVVGVEGSHLNHALMALPKGAGLLAIQPPDRFNMFNKYMCEYASLRFGFVVADASTGGFIIEPQRLARTIELF